MRYTRRIFWMALPAALALGLGCGRAKPSAEMAQAREVLETSLEAWAKGERVTDLQKRSPPIRFADDNWQAGHRLLDFQMGRVRTTPERVPSCRVLLSLQDKQGKKLEREVVYQVAVKPDEIIVGRDPMN